MKNETYNELEEAEVSEPEAEEPELDVSELLPIYSRDDGFYITTGEDNLYHLVEGDELAPDGLWDSVMAFIAENPGTVQPWVEPEPEPFPEPEPMPEPEFETAEEWREYQYQMRPIIDFGHRKLTVDEAVLKHSSYYAEWLAEHEVTEPIPDDNPVHILSVKIHNAKDRIREEGEELFPASKA